MRATDAIETVNDEVTSIQTKTDLITVANAVDLDQVTTDIGNNASNITGAVNAANSAIGIANSAASQSATALQGVATNGNSITAIQTKPTTSRSPKRSTLTTLKDKPTASKTCPPAKFPATSCRRDHGRL